MSCDANSAYRLDEVEHLRKFDRFELLMIEQPLWNDDIYYHARLQRELKTAICLDESIRHARDAAAAVETGACRIVNVKVGRVGGFSEARKVHDVCQDNNVPVWCGGMLETGVGRAHNIALSTLPNFRLPGDVSASKRYTTSSGDRWWANKLQLNRSKLASRKGRAKASPATAGCPLLKWERTRSSTVT